MKKSPVHLGDEELLRLMLVGDGTAFAQLYQRRQSGVYRFALRMTGAGALAEDITQDVFLTLMRDAGNMKRAASSCLIFSPSPGAACYGGYNVNGGLSRLNRTTISSRTARLHLKKPSGQTYKINYSTDGAGQFTYEFVDPAGNKRTENYTRRGFVSSVSGASYNGAAPAAESITAMFGAGLSNATRVANTTPLPTSLNGTTINVIDSLGVSRLSPLFFVSPGQGNYQIPPGTAPGVASVSVNINDAFTGFGELNIATVAPGLFTADASGQGYPAAAYRYRGNSLVAVESLTQLDATNKVIAKPLDLGPETDSIFLVLFGTGLRFRSSLSGVTPTIGGAPAEVLFAGAQTDFVGMDQVNVRVPRSLATMTGDVNIVLTVDGKTANTVKINLKSGATSAIAWSMLKLPDIGQTGDFSATFGEDSDYTINPPAFTTNNDGTLTDNITGLQWQQGDGGEMTWDNARGYCDGLTLAGKDDWRLPGLHESFSVLNHNTVNPAIATAFTRTQAEYWWAAELRSDDATRAWATNAGGGSGPHSKTETVSGGGTKRFHARCVRTAGAGLSLTTIYKDNANGTITDNRTNLTWQQADTADKNWGEAIAYCEGLTLAGASDWRLPNIKELTSINDESRVRPSLSLIAFPNAVAALFWASTTQINQTVRANSQSLDCRFQFRHFESKRQDRSVARAVRARR